MNSSVQEMKMIFLKILNFRLVGQPEYTIVEERLPLIHSFPCRQLSLSEQLLQSIQAKIWKITLFLWLRDYHKVCYDLVFHR